MKSIFLVLAVLAFAGVVSAHHKNTPEAPVVPMKNRPKVYVTDHQIFESTTIVRGSSSSSSSASAAAAAGAASGPNGSVSAAGAAASASSSSNSSIAGSSHTQAGDDPRTTEEQADIFASCPNIAVTNDPAQADFVMVLRRRGGVRSEGFALGGLTGLLIASGAKVNGGALFTPSGDLVFATKQRSVQKAIVQMCQHVPPKQ